MSGWEKKYRERVIEQNLLREPKDFEEQADIAEDKWIILTELLEEQQDTINELKNTIERQEILIEKLRCCENCNGFKECIVKCNVDEECINNNKSKWTLESEEGE